LKVKYRLRILEFLILESAKRLLALYEAKYTRGHNRTNVGTL
jgi:hypothetical protein